ncbi:Ig-like domain-containing protein [Microbulbifer bruguierae]|uniref:Ig-like domain-containing protein n=1 Tax=Microbulbifer bruguierae TaxID=3029061 RepID=A0ABY8NB07_9GAMM|nr:Ig-like domain-containing protein [Microbulbifer bruguierae]WGL16109.1 Ig-like domain-containing protein [Microbulbifer bruguierae]
MTRNLTALVISSVLILAGCELTEDDKDRLKDAQVDLEQLADQIIITYPANGSTVTSSTTDVRVDIPAAAGVQAVSLYVDGVEIASDEDGAPWEFSWPSYYWADGGAHTLLLKALTENGNEVRNNQQFQVTVATSANSDLQFSGGLDGSSVKDTNQLSVGFELFPGATRYQVVYSTGDEVETVDTESNSAQLSDLDVGVYQIRYRAIGADATSNDLVGPLSSPVSVELLAPDLPALNPAEVVANQAGYDVLLSWADLGEGNSYRVNLLSGTAGEEILFSEATEENSITIPDLPLGNYRWQLQRTNGLGQDSGFSAPQALGVGVFERRLGGSANDHAKQVLSASDGGFILRGYTKSPEIFSAVDSDGDDWIIKLDSQGNVVWDYVSSAGGRDRFTDLVELSDGSIVAVGMDWDSDKAVILKLDSTGAKLWETLYRPESISERYDFVSVVEFDGGLFAAAAEWGPAPGCANCTRRLNFYFHRVDAADGTVADEIPVPALEGVRINTLAELKVTAAGELLVAGHGMPAGDETAEYWQGGAYLQVLDADLGQKVTWNNVGNYRHGNVGDVIERPDGSFVVVGQVVDDGRPVLSLVGSNGAEFQNRAWTSDRVYYGSESIAAGAMNETYGLFLDQETDALILATFGSDLVVDAQRFLEGLSAQVSSAGLVYNPDGTITYFLSESLTGHTNYDLVISRQPVEQN